jgi:hypothetical protein
MDSVRNTTLSQVRVYRIQCTHKAHEDYKYCSLVQIHLQIQYLITIKKRLRSGSKMKI